MAVRSDWEIGCKHKATAPGRAEVRMRFRRGRLTFALCIDCEERAGDRPAQVIGRALQQIAPAMRQLSDECSQRAHDLAPVQRGAVVPIQQASAPSVAREPLRGVVGLH